MAAAAASKKTLAKKLSEITGKIARIEKKGENKAQHYNFVRESDLAEEASKLFDEYGIFVLQNVAEAPEPTPLFVSSSGSQMWLTRVCMEFTIIDAEGDETLGPVKFWGAGADTGDKGIYKAMTGAEKYFLMKTFLVATGDDPEADEKVDKAAAGASAKMGAKVSGKASTTAKRGGKTDGITGAQMKAIGDLIKAKGITAPGYLAVVAMTVDGIDAEDADANVITRGLTSAQAGEVIQALDGLEEPKTDASGGGEEAEPDEHEGMSVV